MRYLALKILVVLNYFLLNSCINKIDEKNNWVQFRNDAGRNGYTAHQISDNLSPRWIINFTPPDIAWEGINTRMTFDHAYQPVIAGNMAYIGNSNDCKIYAIDRKTGEIAWSYYTDGPVRFAPAIHSNRLYAVSDDGNVYCLSAKTGKLIWKKYCGPKQDMVLGNERMISRWPVRGGLVIKDGILYTGAGIWPSEKIFIYALNPRNGNVVWVNDSCGEIEMPQPHNGAVAKSGLSAQGYFTVGGDKLFVPTGRAVPAALNIKTGKLEYFHLQEYRNLGGSDIMATDSFLFVPSGNIRDLSEIKGNSISFFNNTDGKIIPEELNSEAIAISPEYLYCINNESHKVEAYNRDSLKSDRETFDRRGNKVMVSKLSDPVWSTDIIEDYVKTMIVTGNRLIAGTLTEKVLIIDNENGHLVSSYKVNGIPIGLAVAQKSLFVSTTKGTMYCFNDNSHELPKVHFNDFTSFNQTSDAVYVKAAEEIISKSTIKNGYCLDLECGDGSLVYELAKKTNLKIVALDNDKKNVDLARKKLSKAGLYGVRVIVLQGDLNSIQLPDYFANLIVSQRSVITGSSVNNFSQTLPCQRPCGGIIITGPLGEMKANVRGELEGAGQWTHQYHDPANTATSEDEIVNGHLEMLWFKDSDYEMPSRHGRGVAPLFKDGRLFVAGIDGIRVVDAYNGHLLWEYYIEDLMTAYDQEHISGTAITQGNWCIEGDRLFVRRGISMYNRAAKDCYVLDTKTGSKIATYNTPDAGYWGYLAVKNGILYGSVANEEHVVKWGYRESDMNNQFSESSSIFAIDVSTGKTLWEYKAENSIRHNTIAIGNNKMYLIDRPIAEMDYLYARRGIVVEHKPGILVALNARTGDIQFRKKDNIWGTLLILNEKFDKLIMSYSDTRYKLPSEKGGKIAVFDASNGTKEWESGTRKNLPSDYSSSGYSRPVVNDSIIFVEPETFDLFTGSVIDNSFQRSYGCGIISGSKNMLFYRSATVGYYCFENQEAGTQNYGGIRPGCWINVIPSGGLVLMPDATNRCDCSYLIKSWIALKPSKE
jgi:outer membrane protein assembly factor BamB